MIDSNYRGYDIEIEDAGFKDKSLFNWVVYKEGTMIGKSEETFLEDGIEDHLFWAKNFIELILADKEK